MTTSDETHHGVPSIPPTTQSVLLSMLEGFSILYPYQGNQPGLQWGLKHDGQLIGIFPTELLAEQYAFYYKNHHTP